jgi:hypothetical protein
MNVGPDRAGHGPRRRTRRGAPGFDTLWQRYRLAVLYGWVAATTTAVMGDMWQPSEVGMSAMRRSTQTCADLETFEAFRDAL